MKKIIFLLSPVFIFLFAAVSTGNANLSGTKEVTVKSTDSGEKSPKASIKIKDKDIFIEIKNLDLNPDEANRLRKEIEKEVKLDKIPKGIKLNMTISITKDMLENAGISIKGLNFDPENIEDNFSLDFNSEGDGDRVKIFDDLTVKPGEVYEDIVVIKGTLDFSGEADNIVVIFGNAIINSTAKINDDLVVLLGSAEVSPNAEINGEQFTIAGGGFIDNIVKFVLIPGAILSFATIPPFIVLIKLLMWLIVFGFAVLMLHIFTHTKEKANDYLKSNLFASLGCGVLSLLTLMPIFFFLLLSIIGIPLIPVFIVLVILMLFGGYAIAALYIGNLLPWKITKEKEIWALLFGMAILLIVSLIPFIGMFAKCLAVITGFGAVSYTLVQTIFKKKKLPPPDPMPVDKVPSPEE